MIVSNGSILQVEDEVYGWDNLAPLAGSWRNLSWEVTVPPDVIWGRLFGKFTFDFVRVNFKFTNLTPPIPADAQIISAVLRGTATATSTADGFFTVIRTLVTDGAWNEPSLLAWRSCSAPGPLSILNTDMDVAVLNIFAGSLADTGISVTHNWGIRDNAAGRGTKAGQGVEVVTGGTLGFVDIRIRRAGTVATGNVWAEIYNQDANGLADTLLATSNTRAASAVPTGQTRFRFTFSGGAQIILAPGQDIVVVLNGDFPVSASQNIQAGWSTGGYAPGTFQLFGTGVGFDDQNYPMQSNFRNILGTDFVVWVAPRFILGVDYDTPELAAMLQNHLQVSGYVEGDPLAFAVERSLFLNPAVTTQRKWASVSHATFEPVRLIVEWREAPLSGVVIGAIIGPDDGLDGAVLNDDELAGFLLGDDALAGFLLGDDALAGVVLNDDALAGAVFGDDDGLGGDFLDDQFAGAVLNDDALAGVVLGDDALAGAVLNDDELAGAVAGDDCIVGLLIDFPEVEEVTDLSKVRGDSKAIQFVVLDNPTTPPGAWTWAGTLLVLATDTSGVIVGDWVRRTSSSPLFKIASLVANVSVTIENPNNAVIPSGAGVESASPIDLGVGIARAIVKFTVLAFSKQPNADAPIHKADYRDSEIEITASAAGEGTVKILSDDDDDVDAGTLPWDIEVTRQADAVTPIAGTVTFTLGGKIMVFTSAVDVALAKRGDVLVPAGVAGNDRPVSIMETPSTPGSSLAATELLTDYPLFVVQAGVTFTLFRGNRKTPEGLRGNFRLSDDATQP